jgi:predicted Zn-ribbon and HTH transcriptional regulator
MADPKIRSVRDLLASAGNVDLAHALHELTDIVEVLWSEREAERLEREKLRAEVADYNQRQRDRLAAKCQCGDMSGHCNGHARCPKCNSDWFGQKETGVGDVQLVECHGEAGRGGCSLTRGECHAVYLQRIK